MSSDRHVRVEGRGRGVAIVRVDGAFVGRVKRVGQPWQVWKLGADTPRLTFIGWAKLRRDGVAMLTQ